MGTCQETRKILCNKFNGMDITNEKSIHVNMQIAGWIVIFEYDQFQASCLLLLLLFRCWRCCCYNFVASIFPEIAE